MNNDAPIIPVITDPELLLSVNSLAQAADSFKKAFLIAGIGKPVEKIIEQHGDHLQLCEAVINHWCKHLSISDDNITG